MTAVRYCTPEWLETTGRLAEANPKFAKAFEKLAVKVCFRVKADKTWGIDADVIFGGFVNKGKLDRLAFFSEEEARQAADYILVATPQEWKKILRKQNKFVTDFMMGRIRLEHGSPAGILGLAPHSDALVDALTQTELQFPDEMSPDELAQYRSHMQEFRARLGV